MRSDAYAKYLEREYNRVWAESIAALIDVLSRPEEEYMRARVREIEHIMDEQKIKIHGLIRSNMENSYLAAMENSLKRSNSLNIAFQNPKMYLNRAGLNAILREKFNVIDRQLNSIFLSLKGDMVGIPELSTLLGKTKSTGEAFTFARRTLDEIRHIGVERIKEAMVSGKSLNITEKNLFDDLRKLGIENKIETLGRLTADNDFLFQLRTKSGKLRYYSAKSYSHLVAVTTSREAAWTGEIETATEIGNNLVQYNFYGRPVYGKGKTYKSLDDPCYKIDGQLFSLKKGYVASNGKVYPYIYDALPKPPYLLPHPRCKHIMSQVSDTPSNLIFYDKIALKNPDGMKPVMAA